MLCKIVHRPYPGLSSNTKFFFSTYCKLKRLQYKLKNKTKLFKNVSSNETFNIVQSLDRTKRLWTSYGNWISKPIYSHNPINVLCVVFFFYTINFRCSQLSFDTSGLTTLVLFEISVGKALDNWLFIESSLPVYIIQSTQQCARQDVIYIVCLFLTIQTWISRTKHFSRPRSVRKNED